MKLGALAFDACGTWFDARSVVALRDRLNSGKARHESP